MVGGARTGVTTPEGAELQPMDDGAGLQLTPDELLEIWEADASMWPLLGPPFRPSEGDVAAYRRLAGERLRGKVLILGCTPELRDAVAATGGQTVVFEMSPAMHATTSRLLRRADPAHETWIRGDWCDVAPSAAEFDLVLADMVWWSTSLRRQHEVRDTIHAALRPDALFVGRFRFTDPARASEDPAEVITHYLERIEQAPGEERLHSRAMMSWLYDHSADHAMQRLDLRRARSLVLDLAARAGFSGHRDYLRGFTDRLAGPDWTSQTREQLLAVVCERFKIVEEASADDYEASLYPVISLRPA